MQKTGEEPGYGGRGRKALYVSLGAAYRSRAVADRFDQASAFRKIKVTLWPPKPKELDAAYSRPSTARAVFGT